MRETRKIEIGGITYKITTLAVKDALAAATRVGKVLGAALRDAKDLKTSDGVLGALGAALVELGPDDLYDVSRLVAKGTFVEPAPGSGNFVALTDVFDAHFQGRLPDMAEWVYAVLEGDVFPLVKGLMLRIGARNAVSIAAQ